MLTYVVSGVVLFLTAWAADEGPEMSGLDLVGAALFTVLVWPFCLAVLLGHKLLVIRDHRRSES